MALSPAPVLYVPHGGGPMPLLGDPAHHALVKYMQSLQVELQQAKAILVVTAHWETQDPAITAQQNPDLVYDYYGFPPEAYQIQYPASGSPELAKAIAELLKEKGFSPQLETQRGYDHGTFVPLKLMLPNPAIPVVQMSLLASLDPQIHIRMGQALAALRERGVAIIGSGMSFHNMRAFFSPTPESIRKSENFNDWLVNCLTNQSLQFAEREKLLVNWQQAPDARYCHPREEHLLPLLVCVGAAGEQIAETNFSSILLNTRVSGFIWR